MSKIIETTNLKKATKLALETISNCEIGVISGQPGMGKSTFKNLFHDRLTEDGHIVSYYCPFKKPGTQTNAILRAIYESAFPEQVVPVNENKKIKDLRVFLRREKPAVLLIDNMQNLDMQTIKEIKVFWEELGNLSILFFLKNDTRMLHLLEDGIEIGHRINHYKFKDLTDKEIEKIANDVHGIMFEDEITKKRFIAICKGNPLSVKYYSSMIRNIPNFNGTATLEMVSPLEIKALKRLLIEYNISIRDLEERLKIEGVAISRGTIGDILNGKKDSEKVIKTKQGNVAVSEVTNTMRRLLDEKRKAKNE